MALQSTTGAVVIGTRELEALIARVRAAEAADTFEMLDAIGDQQENAARRRLFDTKTAPDGRHWAPWSKAYAKTRGPGKSLGRDAGHLGDSMTHVVDGKDAVLVGSNMVYAGAFQHGLDYTRMRDRAHVSMPGRPYLDTEPGFADSRDRDEIREITRDFLRGLL
jgi:phage virion morphogenesis protein